MLVPASVRTPSPMDLLHRSPRSLEEGKRASELKRCRERLTFGFARGTDEAELIEMLIPAWQDVSFDRESFEQDLFLDQLLQDIFVMSAQGRRYDACRPFLRKILVSPPRVREDAEFRQEIFRELLGAPALQEGLEKAYVELRAFRATLAGIDGGSGSSQSVRRRIDILSALRRCVLQLQMSFAGARSGLERIAHAAHQMSLSESFARLEKLLSFEDQRAVLESRLQVGYDGTLRRFDIVRVTEIEYPGFPATRRYRWFRRLMDFLRGHRFSEENIMSNLLDSVFSSLEEETLSLLRLSLELEFYLSGLHFHRRAEKAGLAVSLPSWSQRRELIELFNPWLLAQGKIPVPCNLPSLGERTTVILTGPNSGGKTRLLQAVAVSQLLGQIGFFVPARQSSLIWVDQLFLSLLEKAEASQEEGRLGMELLRIRRVFETSGPSSLVIMDELCSGTNPSEGEEIFEMVLELLEELQAQVFISTHFLDFAKQMQKQDRPSLHFLQVEIGEHELPTYQFVPGVAQTSLAQITAGRLGVTRDELRMLVEEKKRQGSRAELKG